MELLEFGEEEENIAPTYIDEDNYDNTTVSCERDDEKYYNLSSSFDENAFAQLV